MLLAASLITHFVLPDEDPFEDEPPGILSFIYLNLFI